MAMKPHTDVGIALVGFEYLLKDSDLTLATE